MPALTPETIQDQILAELHRRDPDAEGAMYLWREIRSHCDGAYWAQIEAATSLMARGDVALVKISGTPMIGLNEFGIAHPVRPLAV